MVSPDLTNPEMAVLLNNLALLYDALGRDAEAAPLYERSLTIKKKALGPDHPSLAVGLYNLATLYHSQGKYAEAEPLYKQSFTIYAAALGPEHPDLATILGSYANLLRSTEREEEAARMEARADAIRDRQALQDSGT